MFVHTKITSLLGCTLKQSTVHAEVIFMLDVSVLGSVDFLLENNNGGEVWLAGWSLLSNACTPCLKLHLSYGCQEIFQGQISIMIYANM